MFPNTPGQQSSVDQLVFGRDMDGSGDDMFDDDFMDMYLGSAGRPSWERPSETDMRLPGDGGKVKKFAMGKRMYANIPNTQSSVDQVIFNHDMDFSGDSVFDETFSCMFEGCAGRKSWEEQPRGLKQFDIEPGKRKVGDPDHHPIKRGKGKVHHAIHRRFHVPGTGVRGAVTAPPTTLKALMDRLRRKPQPKLSQLVPAASE